MFGNNDVHLRLLEVGSTLSWPEDMETIVDWDGVWNLVEQKKLGSLFLFTGGTSGLPTMGVISVDPTGRRFIRRTGAPG